MHHAARILFCHCRHGQAVPAEARQRVLQTVCVSGAAFQAVPDLCELAATHPAFLRRFACGPALILTACPARAVGSLFAAAGFPFLDPAPHVRRFAPELTDSELRSLIAQAEQQSTAQADAPATTDGLILGVPWNTVAGTNTAGADPASELLALALNKGRPVFRTADTRPDLEARVSSTTLPGQPNGWQAWYPVIDPVRCNQCMQCLNFCLFGVFGVGPGKRVRVQAPAQCKTLCPACARVCPENAILFPKHPTPPINGDLDSPPEPGWEKMDISTLLGGDLYATLRARSALPHQRFSADRDVQSARRERQRRLAEALALRQAHLKAASTSASISNLPGTPPGPAGVQS